MDIVRVVHLSDLHFAPKKNLAVWISVCEFINEKIKPHFILITGDVTDNAKNAEFELAVGEIGRLQRHPDGDLLTYRIVPGNHDCQFWLGNTIPFVARFAKDKSARFAKHFGAHAVNVNAPVDFATAIPDWKIRVLGLDSNDARQYFAQGYVGPTTIASAVEAARGLVDRDLVITLVHHHVLPIAALESDLSNGGKISKLANVTGLLNSGTLLNSLSRSHVDLVLHGHEHKTNQARFGCLQQGSSNVVVLAAGSGTGAATGGNFELGRVHFNVLELQGDRSVWLREVARLDDGTLGYSGDRTLLISAPQIRQSRFVRRNRPQPGEERKKAFPSSRLRKLVRFTDERDIEITETRSIWFIKESFTQFSHNVCGHVGLLSLSCQWAGGVGSEYSAEFLPDRKRTDRYYAEIKFDNALSKSLDSVTACWTWRGGAAFTVSELEGLKQTTSDEIHDMGREYAAIRANGEFESLSLILEIPSQFAPEPDTVRVYVEGPNTAGPLLLSTELTQTLQFCGPGFIELHVPFPLPHYEYYVTWPVASNLSSPAQRTFAGAANRHAKAMISLCLTHLSGLLDPKQLRADIYISSLDNNLRFDRVPSQPTDAPPFVSLSQPRSLARLAWLGSLTAYGSREGSKLGQADADFCADELAVAWVPFMQAPYEDDDGLSIGLLRVGLMETLSTSGEEIEPQYLMMLLANATGDMMKIAMEDEKI